MPTRRLLWIAVCVVIAGAVAGWWMLRRSAPDQAPPTGFDSAGVTVHSPQLRLEVTDVQGVVQGDLMRWSCDLLCREPDGCRADIVIKIFYRSGGNPRRFAFDGTIDASSGDSSSFGGVQRPPAAVDAVERVEISVRRFFTPEEPTPVAFE